MSANYYEQANVGRAKYVVSFTDGVKKHNDGSPFYDVKIFTNKARKDKFIAELVSKGFTQRTS